MTSTETHLIPTDPEALADHILAARSVIGAWRDFLAQQSAINRTPEETRGIWMAAADLLGKGHHNRAKAAEEAPAKHAEGVDVGGRRPITPGLARPVRRKDFSVYGLGPENRELLSRAAEEAGVSRNKLVQQYLIKCLVEAGFEPADPTDVDVEVPDN